jgi:hypothetical protein
MNLVSRLLTVADAFGVSRGLSPSRVSTLAFGDGKVIARLRDGRDVTTNRYEAAMQWFSDHWPETAEWPDGVMRPTPAPQKEAAE